MKARLYVRYTVYDPDVELPADTPNVEKYREVTKEFDLDFVPVEGLHLMFTNGKTAQQNLNPDDDYSGPDHVFFTGIFEVEGVLYDVRKRTLMLQAYEAERTEQAMRYATDRLIRDYGFAPPLEEEELEDSTNSLRQGVAIRRVPQHLAGRVPAEGTCATTAARVPS